MHAWHPLEIDSTGQTLRLMPLIIYEPVSDCLRFKGRQDKEELYPLLAAYPLELVHMDFMTTENPHTHVDVNILVITDHFTWYAWRPV